MSNLATGKANRTDTHLGMCCWAVLKKGNKHPFQL